MGADGGLLFVDGVPDGDRGRGLSRAPATKAEERLAELSDVFDAIAHEQRRHILLTLHFRGGELSAREIADRFACSWPTTTRHLAVLRRAQLVTVEKRGRQRFYRLDRARLLSIVGDWLDVFRGSS